MNIEDLGRRIVSHQGSMTLTTSGYDLQCDFKAGYDEEWKDSVLLDFKPHEEPPMFKEFRAFAKRMTKKYGLGNQVFGGIVGTNPTKKKKKGNKPRGR